jgi:signal transduction histidine kinase
MTHDEFITLFAHELRGPIGALGSAAMVLRDCDPASALAGEAREIIARQSQRLADTVEDLQVLGRLVSPQTPMRTERVDLARLLQTHCDCEIGSGAEDVRIDTDRGRIEDALARTAAEAPSRIKARIEPEEKEAAALFTLEPVGGGLGVQLLRVLLEHAGAQVSIEPCAQGRRLAARLAR